MSSWNDAADDQNDLHRDFLCTRDALASENVSWIDQLHMFASRTDALSTRQQKRKLSTAEDDYANSSGYETIYRRGKVFLALTPRETCLDSLVAADSVHDDEHAVPVQELAERVPTRTTSLPLVEFAGPEISVARSAGRSFS